MNNDLISRSALLSALNELFMAALRKDEVSVESVYELDHLSMLVKDAPPWMLLKWSGARIAAIVGMKCVARCMICRDASRL